MSCSCFGSRRRIWHGYLVYNGQANIHLCESSLTVIFFLIDLRAFLAELHAVSRTKLISRRRFLYFLLQVLDELLLLGWWPRSFGGVDHKGPATETGIKHGSIPRNEKYLETTLGRSTLKNEFVRSSAEYPIHHFMALSKSSKVATSGSLVQPCVPHVRPQWPHYWFYPKYSSNSAGAHIFPRCILLGCLHETLRGMYHWSSMTQDGREHPEIGFVFPLTVSYPIFFQLSATNSSITTYSV